MAKKRRSISDYFGGDADELVIKTEEDRERAIAQAQASLGSDEQKPALPGLQSYTSEPSLISSKKTQRFYLPLPVSGREAECFMMDIDPDECFVSKFNIRRQSLLSRNDPENVAIIDSIRSNRQQTPVLIRPAPAGSGFKYELIYGSRRRWAVKQIREEGDNILLKAWFIQDLADPDARALSRDENRNRADMSSWEEAMYAFERINSDKVSQSEIASELGYDRTAISRLLKIATLPEELVAMVASLKTINKSSGYNLALQYENATPSERRRVIELLKSNAPYKDSKSLSKAFDAVLDEIRNGDSPKELKKNDKIEISGERGMKVTFSRHRTHENRFKAEFEGFTFEELQAYIDYIKAKI